MISFRIGYLFGYYKMLYLLLIPETKYNNTKPISYLEANPWPCGLGHRSEADRLLGLRVRNPLRERILVSCVCCVLCT